MVCEALIEVAGFLIKLFIIFFKNYPMLVPNKVGYYCVSGVTVALWIPNPSVRVQILGGVQNC